MGAISKLTVGTVTATPITATVWGNNVQVVEDISTTTATTKFTVFLPKQLGGGPTTVGATVGVGGLYNFFKGMNYPMPYRPGDIVGYIQSITGTVNFIIIESGA